MRKPIKLALIVLSAILHGITHVRPYDDIESEVYYGLTRYIRGEVSFEYLLELSSGIRHFLLRPVTPMIASILYPNVNIEMAFIITNLIMLVLGTLFVYKLSEAFGGEKAAFSSAILFPSLPVILRYAVGSRVDMSGFMFAPLLAYLILFKAPRWNSLRYLIPLGLLTGIGILSRESNVFVLILVFIMLLARRLSLKQFITISGSALVFPALWMLCSGLTYVTTYEELLVTHSGYEGILRNPILFLESFAGFSLPAIILSVVGFIYSGDELMKKTYMLFASLLIPLVPIPQIPDVRVTFILFPPIVALMGIGLVRLSDTISSKPLLRRLNGWQWMVILLVTILVYSNYRGLQWLRLIPIGF